MTGITARTVALIALVVCVWSGSAHSASTPAESNDEPVCHEGVWATQGNERKYVCLTWRFRDKIYTLDQLEVVLAELGRPVALVASPPNAAPETSPRPEQKPLRLTQSDDDDDDDDEDDDDDC